MSYRLVGRLVEAIAVGEQALAACDRALGPDHPQTFTARHHLGSSYRQAGRTDEAMRLLTSVVEDRTRILGPAHPDTAQARAELAAVLGERGRPQRPSDTDGT